MLCKHFIRTFAGFLDYEFGKPVKYKILLKVKTNAVFRRSTTEELNFLQSFALNLVISGILFVFRLKFFYNFSFEKLQKVGLPISQFTDDFLFDSNWWSLVFLFIVKDFHKFRTMNRSQPESTRKALLILGTIFISALLMLFLVYTNFPKLEPWVWNALAFFSSSVIATFSQICRL